MSEINYIPISKVLFKIESNKIVVTHNDKTEVEKMLKYWTVEFIDTSEVVPKLVSKVVPSKLDIMTFDFDVSFETPRPKSKNSNEQKGKIIFTMREANEKSLNKQELAKEIESTIKNNIKYLSQIGYKDDNLFELENYPLGPNSGLVELKKETGEKTGGGKGKQKSKPLDKCTVVELKEKAKRRNIKGFSKMNKTELVSVLRRK